MDEDVAALYRGSLDDFIGRRVALARTLRSRDGAAAARVAKLRKPSVTAWAIDQLAAAQPQLVAEVLAAGAGARDAQAAAAGGAVGGDDLREATARLRHAVDAAVSAIASSHPLREEGERRIRTTLQAAAVGRAADRTALWRGTLDRDLEPAPFAATAEPEEDPPGLTAAISALRSAPVAGRDGPPASARPRPAQPLAERAAARRAATLRDAATRAGAIAVARREHADRLAEAARIAEEEAVAAEREADRARAVADAQGDERR